MGLRMQLSGTLDAAARRVAQRIPEIVRARMEEEASRVLADARRAWPVGRDRGRPHSRDRFALEVVQRGDVTEARITNSTAWFADVRIGGELAVDKLIRAPLSAALARVVRGVRGGL